jgi:O-methyltransferase involved in polyketide biosynthesis
VADGTGGRQGVEIDTTIPHPARVYDYWIGGKDNYAPDRELAEAMIRQVPTIPMMARANREFLGRAVRYLVAEAGVRQFLDIGSGIPTASNVHQVAQGIDPTARVLYVDNDPIVLAHSRALLTSTPEGATAFVAGDARDPQAILGDPAVTATLDRTQPVALMLVSMLMYFDDDLARGLVTTLMDALPPGSHLTISHPTGEFDPTGSDQANAVAARGGITYNTRTRAGVERLFDGFDLVSPGVVPMLEWHPDVIHPHPRSVYYWVGMATKRA